MVKIKSKKPSVLAAFDFIGAPLLAGIAVGLFLMESRRVLRKRKQSRMERLQTNAGVAAVAATGLRWVLLPGIVRGAAWAHQRQQGLVAPLKLPAYLSYPLSFLLLDYGNYLWHIMLHRSKLLWRFHAVHHSDLDLDLTTAWRFHIGEVLMGTPVRAGVAWLSSAPPLLVVVYEIVYELATAFHHSNWRLPYLFEKRLNRWVVTPRMHGIHHSIVQQETDSNYAIVLSCWDRLHRTVRLNVHQEAINIGMPAYRDPQELTFQKLMALPFAPQRTWHLPNGEVPKRREGPDTRHLLP